MLLLYSMSGVMLRRLYAVLCTKQERRDVGKIQAAIPAPAVCTASENHVGEDGQDSAGSRAPWKVSELSHQPCTVLLIAQPWLTGGKRVKGVSLGSWGAVFLTKSQILHPWVLALLARRGHGWRKVLPLILANANSQNYKGDAAPLAAAECLKTDPRQLNVLPGTSARSLQRSGSCKINVFEDVFCRSLSGFLFPLNEIWAKITSASAKESHLCYSFSPGCTVFAQAPWCVLWTRGSHPSEESQHLQEVFLHVPEGLPVSQCSTCSGRLFSPGLLGFLELLSLLKMALDNSAKTFLEVMWWVKWKNPPLVIWTQSDSGSKDAAPRFSLVLGVSPTYFSRKGEKWKGLQFMALNERSCTGPFLMVWGFSQEGPASQVWSSLGTERAAGIML